MRVFTSGWAALGTSGRAKVAAEASELNTTGPYSLVRNPLYVGRILNFTGLAMLSGSWVFGAIVFLLAARWERRDPNRRFPFGYRRGNSLAFLIGPEGGLSEAEVEQAKAAGFHAARLGPRVLRTETAPVVALAVAQQLWGDF